MLEPLWKRCSQLEQDFRLICHREMDFLGQLRVWVYSDDLDCDIRATWALAAVRSTPESNRTRWFGLYAAQPLS
jgi:hypothetical protein